MVRWLLAVSLLAACGQGERARPPAGGGSGSGHGSAIIARGSGSAASPAQCAAVRDHVVGLIAAYYVRHPEETWDGLDRSDPALREGLDPAMTRDNFATFLASEAGEAWLTRARERTIRAPAMTETVDKCIARAGAEHVTCWLEATTFEAFQACPNPP